MQPKTITIPYNYDDFLDTQKNIWTFSHKKFVKINITFTIWAAVLLFINLILNNRDRSPIIIGIECGYLFYLLLSWSAFYERRIRFIGKRKKAGQRFGQESLECTYTFSENDLEYQDKEKYYKLNWSLFNPYLIFRDTILLTGKDTGAIIFTLSKKEIGEEYYQEICAILKEKVGFNEAKK